VVAHKRNGAISNGIPQMKKKLIIFIKKGYNLKQKYARCQIYWAKKYLQITAVDFKC